jgi:hypothetical protein
LAAGGAQKAGEFRCVVNFCTHKLWRWCTYVDHLSNMYVFSFLTRFEWCNFKLFPHRRRIWTNSRSCALSTRALKPSMRSQRPVLMMRFVSAMQRFASDIF